MLHLEREVFRYCYLSEGGCSYVLTMEDDKQFHVTIKAMEVIGFSPEDISSVLEMLAAILNLGNVTFAGYSLPNGTDACKVTEGPAIGYVCDMLGSSVELMKECLTIRSVHTTRDYVQKPLSESEAVFARDALGKAIYDRLFTWLVGRINDSIKAKSLTKKKVMGVLDIYGFEIFETNSFEQFIINYCNEKLQQVFIKLTLKSEQEEYIRENVRWKHIDYFNNAIICELIEHPTTGILALLDEECLRPGETTDDTFLEKLDQRCAGVHPHYESRALKALRSDQTMDRDQFRLVHYAGNVTYSVVGFLEKNRDLLFKDLSQAMFACERPLLKTLFPEGNPKLQTLKRPPTMGYQFRSSVAQLMKNLLTKNPNYIRCIKPNDVKSGRNFNDALVQHQVRYLGLMENVRVRRAGFAYRQEYGQCLVRYKMLSGETWPVWKGNPREGVKEILSACGCHELDFTCGRTKIFIRNPRTVFAMEDKRRTRLHDLATLVSKTWRGFYQWSKFQTMRSSQIIIAAWYRRYCVQKWYMRTKGAALVVQKYYRGWVARMELRRLKWLKRAAWAVGVITKYFLGWRVRKAVREMKRRQREREAVLVIQKYCRGWKVRKEIRGLFKQVAGPKVAVFMWKYMCYNFLLTILRNAPSTSPLDDHWPQVSILFEKSSELLREIHHRWRCKVMRDYYQARPKDKKRMMEKLRASNLFKGKKSLYDQTVAVPFESDRLSLRSDHRWSKIVAETNEQRIIWTDRAHKINRRDGKGVPIVLVVTGMSIMILDPKSLVLKYRIDLRHVNQVSVSSFSDHLLVLHINPFKATDRSYTKGDFVLKTTHVIELVTKLSSVVKETLKNELKVAISNTIIAHFKVDEDPCTITFQRDQTSTHRPSPVCRRRANTLQIIV
jgi:myosin-1